MFTACGPLAGKSGLDQWNLDLLPTNATQDPDGRHIARWVPELAALPERYRHRPWAAPADVLQAAGVTLGVTYPHRIVGVDPASRGEEDDDDAPLAALREHHLRAVRVARALHADKALQGYDAVVAPKVRFLSEFLSLTPDRCVFTNRQGSSTADGSLVTLYTRADLRGDRT